MKIHRDDPDASARKNAVAAVVILVVLQVLLYGSTYLSMADIWWRSQTFSHGFLIFPISGFLIWRKRAELGLLPLRADLRALGPLLLLVLGWAVARSVDVLVGEQFVAVCMLPVLVWLCFGLPALRALMFPLAFLLLAVPVGEFLTYPMMRFTAAFTVNAVRLTGIPVYWDGMYFTLPSGTWNVVEACSGLRYIIASVTLGVLYAYITYCSYWRRALFVLAACVVPVIANGMRAFIIVMLGHFSGMKLAVGVDHLIYGWVWFGIVMFLLFWVGSFWREDEQSAEFSGASVDAAAPLTARSWYAVSVPALLLLLLGPAWLGWLDARSDNSAFRLEQPAVANGWAPSGSFTEWKPRYIKPVQELQTSYSNGGQEVGVYLAYYQRGHDGSELINSQNVMIEENHPVWRQPSQVARAVRVGDREIAVLETTLKSNGQNLLTWHWSRAGRRDVSDPFRAKIYEALAQLSGQGGDGFAIVVYTPYAETLDPARARLQQFVEAMLPSLDDVLAID